MSEYVRNLRRGRGFKQTAKPVSVPARPDIPARPVIEVPEPVESIIQDVVVTPQATDLLFTLNTSNITSYVFFELGTSTDYELGKVDTFFPVRQLVNFPISSLFGSLTAGVLYFYRLSALPTNIAIDPGPAVTGMETTVTNRTVLVDSATLALATRQTGLELVGGNINPLTLSVGLLTATMTPVRTNITYDANLEIDVNLASLTLTTQKSLVSTNIIVGTAQLAMTPQAFTLGNSPPVWSTDIPDFNFVSGTPSGIQRIITSNNSPKVSDPDGDALELSFNAGEALPNGVTVSFVDNGTGGKDIRVLYDGTPGSSSTSEHTVTADDATEDSDWVARSTASGVMVTNNFDTYADIGADGLATTPGVNGQANSGDPANGLFEWDQTRKLSGGGSYKVILNTPGATNAATFSWPLDGNLERRFNYDEGWNEFYVQFAFYAPAETVQVFFDVNDTSAGPKICIIDHFRGTASSSEVVLMDHQQDGFVATYIGLGNPNSGTISTYAPGIADYRIQSAVDAGGPLNNTNDYWVRYGPMLYASGVNTFFDNQALRTNVPNSLAAINGQGILPDEWCTFTQHVKLRPDVGGQGNSIYQLWGSKYGEAPKLLTSRNNFKFYLSSASDITDPTSGPGFSGVNLTNFVTSLKSFGTGPTDTPLPYSYETWYDELITSREPINHPGGFSLPGILT